MNIEFNRKQRIAIFVLVLVAIILFVASVGYSIGVNKTTAELTKTCDERVRGVQFDKAAAAVKLADAQRATETAEAGAKQAVERITADKNALLSELDADGDGVRLPYDWCPNSPLEPRGGITAVNAKGCMDIEAVRTCAEVENTVDNPGVQYSFLKCPLADDSIIGYVCTASYDKGHKQWIFTECHGDPGSP